MLSEFWRWLTTGRYTRTLEQEVERLRAENRALVNSLLGTAGVPPLSVGPAATSVPAVSGSGARGVVPLQPIRKRSWQQIGRMLEMEEARLLRRPASRFPGPAMGGAASEPGRPAGAGGKIPCGEVIGANKNSAD